jgi:hypothetical protein
MYPLPILFFLFLFLNFFHNFYKYRASPGLFPGQGAARKLSYKFKFQIFNINFYGPPYNKEYRGLCLEIILIFALNIVYISFLFNFWFLPNLLGRDMSPYTYEYTVLYILFIIFSTLYCTIFS